MLGPERGRQDNCNLEWAHACQDRWGALRTDRNPEPDLVSCPRHCVTAVFTCRDLGGYLFTQTPRIQPFSSGDNNRVLPKQSV